MVASRVEQDFEFARGYIESMPEIGAELVRAVGLSDDAKAFPDELSRLAMALAELDSSLRALHQSKNEAAVAKRLRQKGHG